MKDSLLKEVKRQYQEADDWIVEYAGNYCIYCCEPATDQDHLLPAGYTGPVDRRQTPTVPACASCNTILGDKLLPTICERCEYVKTWLEKKHRRRLRLYSEKGDFIGDPEQYGPSLRSRLEARSLEMVILRQRLTVLGQGGCWRLHHTEMGDLI